MSANVTSVLTGVLTSNNWRKHLTVSPCLHLLYRLAIHWPTALLFKVYSGFFALTFIKVFSRMMWNWNVLIPYNQAAASLPWTSFLLQLLPLPSASRYNQTLHNSHAHSGGSKEIPKGFQGANGGTRPIFPLCTDTNNKCCKLGGAYGGSPKSDGLTKTTLLSEKHVKFSFDYEDQMIVA